MPAQDCNAEQGAQEFIGPLKFLVAVGVGITFSTKKNKRRRREFNLQCARSSVKHSRQFFLISQNRTGLSVRTV
jgi:hypothetical protein